MNITYDFRNVIRLFAFHQRICFVVVVVDAVVVLFVCFY